MTCVAKNSASVNGAIATPSHVARCITMAALLLGTSCLLVSTGCSSPEMEMINARLERSRLVFVQESTFTVMKPPLFSSPGELSAHESGGDVYEKNFKAQFPPRQEDWLATFRPIDSLPDALQSERQSMAVAQKNDAATPNSSAPQRVYYLIPLEGADIAIIQKLEATIRQAGFDCVPNKPGDAQKLPMPPRGMPAGGQSP